MPTSDRSSVVGVRHITRDFRNLSGQGGRELELVDAAEDFPPTDSEFNTDEGAIWKTPNGWWQRQGQYWCPIYEPHEVGVVDAVADAAAGNIACRPAGYGNGCPGADFDIEAFIDNLTEAGWRIVRATS
jgi:hypothetical protein